MRTVVVAACTCRRFGELLAAAGCGWFLLEWNNPGVGSPLVFTIGLVLYAAAAPLVAHALLIYPAVSLGRVERAVLALAYGGSLLALGLLPALVFDPAGQGCSQCPRNLLLVHGSPSLYRELNRGGVYVGLAWTLLVLALAGWRIACSTAAVRRLSSRCWPLAACTWVWSRLTSRRASTRLSLTDQLDRVCGWARPVRSLRSRWRSRGPGCAGAGHGRRLRAWS